MDFAIRGGTDIFFLTIGKIYREYSYSKILAKGRYGSMMKKYEYTQKRPVVRKKAAARQCGKGDGPDTGHDLYQGSQCLPGATQERLIGLAHGNLGSPTWTLP